MNKKTLQVLVLLILIINIVTTVFLVALTDRSIMQFTAQASSAQFELCINRPPELTIPCNATLVQDQEFFCQLNGFDDDPGQNVTFGAFWPEEEDLFFPDPITGIINWTPTNDESGFNYTVFFLADDNFNCSNSVTAKEWNFSIENINDPPVFMGPIPDQNVTANFTTLLFPFSDYFFDPDGDPLSYTVAVENGPFSVGPVGGSLQVRAESCTIDPIATQIIASDGEFNVSSNIFFINVDCPDSGTDSGQGTAATGGGGGGGGGDAGICRPDMQCLDWYPCLPTGYQWMHCYDMNGCRDPVFLKRECDYRGPQPTCEENWLCTDWGPCQPEGKQYRECEDLAQCGSTIFRPVLEQTCEYTGAVRPPFIETPAFIEPERLNMWLLFIALASSFLIIGALRVYHEELLRTMSKLKLLLARKQEQELWLTREQRSYYLNALHELETTIQQDQPYERITQVARLLFSDLAQLPGEMVQEEFIYAIDKRKPSKELKLLLQNTFERIYALEQENFALHKPLFYSYTEELRLIVCLLSPQNINELERELEEFEITDEQSYLEEALIRVVKIYRALQFNQQHFAQEEYEALITTYEDLPIEDQELLFEDTQKTFVFLHYARERLQT